MSRRSGELLGMVAGAVFLLLVSLALPAALFIPVLEAAYPALVPIA